MTDRSIESFEELFRAYHAPLCEVVDSYVRSQDTAEEIVQDLFLTLWLKRDALQRADSIPAYLFGAARNRAVQYLRHRSVVRKWTDLLSRERTDMPGADRQLEQAETDRAVRAAIDRLPPRTRLALVLRIDHAMSHADVATAMGITVKGVEKLLATARAKLRGELGAHADAVVDR